MTSLWTAVRTCIEHERLAFERLEVRTRGRYLTRMRRLSRAERTETGTGASGQPWQAWSIMTWTMGAAVEDGVCERARKRLDILSTKW